MKNFILALRTFFRLALPYFRSQDRWRACGLLAGVISSELFVVYVAVKMNQWNAGFFNAVEARNGEAVRGELIVFVFITIGAILSGMGQYWFGQTLIIRWREWMTQRYVALWMAEGRHYRIRFVDQTVDNIHLRIGNDVLLFIQRTHELGTGFLQSIVSLLSFAYILWGISLIAPLPLLGVDLSFPGYLVVLAIGYAALGTLVAHYIGWPLIPLQFRQQRFESDFRFAIARVTDYADSVALMGGEAVERGELRRRFSCAGAQLGCAGQSAESIERLHLRLLPRVDRVPGADRHARLSRRRHSARRVDAGVARIPEGGERVRLLHHLLCQDRGMAGGDEPRGAIRGGDGRGGSARPGRCVARYRGLGGARSVDQGARSAASDRRADRIGARARSRARRSAAGERSVGRRQVEPVPRARRHLAARRRPHPFPAGSAGARFAAAALFPARHAAAGHDLSDARGGGRRCAGARGHGGAGLGHLAERLDEEAEWSTVLSGGEQQRVGFARALIHRPTILLLDEAVSTLEEQEARDLYGLLAEKLPDTIIISTGRSGALAGLHHRTMEMTGCSVAGRARPVLAAVPA